MKMLAKNVVWVDMSCKQCGLNQGPVTSKILCHNCKRKNCHMLLFRWLSDEKIKLLNILFSLAQDK